MAFARIETISDWIPLMRVTFAFKLTRNRVQGVTLVELIISIAIMGVLTALLLPVMSHGIQSAKQTKSLGNLKTIGQAIHLYVSENQGFFPPMSGSAGSSLTAPFWCREALAPYLTSGMNTTTSSVMIDPFVPAGRHGGLSDYACNSDVLRSTFPGYAAMNALPMAALAGRGSQVMMVMAAEDPGRALPNGAWYMNIYSVVANPTGSFSRPSDRGIKRIMSVFVDGHTEAVSRSDFIANCKNYLLVDPAGSSPQYIGF